MQVAENKRIALGRSSGENREADALSFFLSIRAGSTRWCHSQAAAATLAARSATPNRRPHPAILALLLLLLPAHAATVSAPAGRTFYVDCAQGSDSADGASPATA